MLRQLGLEDPNPHVDLWAWYGKWSRDLGSYAERRAYIRETFQPLLDAIEGLEEGSVGSGLTGSDATGWAAVDGQVAQLRIRFATCTTTEDAQALGLLCRDIMISLAQALHDPALHGDVGTSAVDQLNAVIDYICSGSSNERLRKLCKATIDYANVVQHRRDCSMADAGVVAEATVAAVNIVRRVSDAAEA